MGKLTIICLILTLGITVACSRGDPVLPTQGLTPAQIQSAVFVEKQATLDLRPEDGTRSPREWFILEGILPAIQEIFPEASIYQDDVLNLPEVLTLLT